MSNGLLTADSLRKSLVCNSTCICSYRDLGAPGCDAERGGGADQAISDDIRLQHEQGDVFAVTSRKECSSYFVLMWEQFPCLNLRDEYRVPYQWWSWYREEVD